jgi:hypothetical protein
LEHIAKNAKEIRNLFGDIYGFEVHKYAIRRDCDLQDFTFDITPCIRKIKRNRQSLFILYYGGHAAVSNNTCCWKEEVGETSPRIDWSTAQRTLFMESECDKLFLLDCCYAGDMIDRRIEWKGACELLGGAITASSRPKAFTRALIEELQDPGLDIRQLWTILTDSEKRNEYSLEVDPYYFDYSGCQHPSISMRALGRQSNTCKELNDCSDARILIKVTFVMSQWRLFLNLPKMCPNSISRHGENQH